MAAAVIAHAGNDKDDCASIWLKLIKTSSDDPLEDAAGNAVWTGNSGYRELKLYSGDHHASASINYLPSGNMRFLAECRSSSNTALFQGRSSTITIDSDGTYGDNTQIFVYMVNLDPDGVSDSTNVAPFFLSISATPTHVAVGSTTTVTVRSKDIDGADGAISLALIDGSDSSTIDTCTGAGPCDLDFTPQSSDIGAKSVTVRATDGDSNTRTSSAIDLHVRSAGGAVVVAEVNEVPHFVSIAQDHKLATPTQTTGKITVTHTDNDGDTDNYHAYAVTFAHVSGSPSSNCASSKFTCSLDDSSYSSNACSGDAQSYSDVLYIKYSPTINDIVANSVALCTVTITLTDAVTALTKAVAVNIGSGQDTSLGSDASIAIDYAYSTSARPPDGELYNVHVYATTVADESSNVPTVSWTGTHSGTTSASHCTGTTCNCAQVTGSTNGKKWKCSLQFTSTDDDHTTTFKVTQHDGDHDSVVVNLYADSRRRLLAASSSAVDEDNMVVEIGMSLTGNSLEVTAPLWLATTNTTNTTTSSSSHDVAYGVGFGLGVPALLLFAYYYMHRRRASSSHNGHGMHSGQTLVSGPDTGDGQPESPTVSTATV